MTVLALASSVAAFASSFANSPVISANPYASLQNGNAYLQQGIPLLLRYHGLTTGDQRQSFGFPQRNYGFRAATATTHHRFASSSTDLFQYGLDAHLAAGAFAAYRDFGSGAAPSNTTNPDNGFIGV